MNIEGLFNRGKIPNHFPPCLSVISLFLWFSISCISVKEVQVVLCTAFNNYTLRGGGNKTRDESEMGLALTIPFRCKRNIVGRLK